MAGAVMAKAGMSARSSGCGGRAALFSAGPLQPRLSLFQWTDVPARRAACTQERTGGSGLLVIGSGRRFRRPAYPDYRSGSLGPGYSHVTISGQLLDSRGLSCYSQRKVAKICENSKYNRMLLVLFRGSPFGQSRNDADRRIVPNMVHTRGPFRGLNAGHKFLFLRPLGKRRPIEATLRQIQYTSRAILSRTLRAFPIEFSR